MINSVQESLQLKLVGFAVVVAVSGGSVGIISYVVTGSQLLLGVTLVATVITSLFIGTLSNTIYNEINQLMEEMRAIAAGELEREVSSDRPDELGDMFRTLDETRVALKTEIEQATQAQHKAAHAKEQAETAQQDLNELITDLEADLNTVMEQAADGDLSQQIDATTDDEVIKSIVRSTNKLISRYRTTIQDIRQFSAQVEAMSDQVRDQVDTVQQTSTATTNSMHGVSNDMQQQNTEVNNIYDELQRISAIVQEVASETTTVADRAQETSRIGQEGKADAVAATEEMQVVVEAVDEVVESANILSEQFDEIAAATSLITDIADETNILALNANIEAARAGEAGSGFAVVADEVKSLSEETKEPAQQIESVINSAEQQMESTVEGVETARSQLTSSVQTIESSVTAFEEMVEHIDETNIGIQEIDNATNQQAESVQEVVAMIDDLSHISTNTLEESQQVVKTTEKQSGNLTDLTESARQVDEVLAEQQQHLGEFDLGTESSGDAELEFAERLEPLETVKLSN